MRDPSADQTAAAAFDALRVRVQRNAAKASARLSPDEDAGARAERVATLNKLAAQLRAAAGARPPRRSVKTSSTPEKNR